MGVGGPVLGIGAVVPLAVQHILDILLLENGAHDTLDHLDSDDYVKVVLEPFVFNLYIHF